MGIRSNTSIMLYLLLALMSVVILSTGIYGISELKLLNHIAETMYADPVRVSEEKIKASQETYREAKRNSYLLLTVSLTFSVLLAAYIIRNVRQLIKSLKQTNNLVQQSEGKFQELMKYAGDAIFMTDAAYSIIEMNDSACKLVAYSREELQKKKIFELMTPEDQSTFASRVKIIDTEGGSLHERILIKKDGSFVATEVNVRPVEGMGYIAIIRDITERKEAENKIRENEERYRSIISVSNTGGWEYHTDTGFVWCSPEYFLMLGRQQSDYDMSGVGNLKEAWLDLLHPQDRERSVNHFTDYLKKGSQGMYESYFRMLHANGSWVWIWSRGQTLRDAQGNPTNLTVGTHIDITASRKATEMFKYQFENSPDTILIINRDFTIETINRSTGSGYKVEELIGKNAVAILPEESREPSTKAILQCFETGLPNEIENALTGNRWVRSRFVPITIDGTVTRIMIIATDLTQIRLSQEKVKQSEEKFRMSFMTSRDAFYIGSLQEGLIIDMNESFCEIFGYTREEALDKTAFELNLYAFPEERTRIVEELKAKGYLKDYELTCRKKNGELILVSISANTLEMNNQQLILAVIRDITERKRIEKELVESDLRFREVLENSISASYKRNLETNTYEYLSPVFKKIAGYTQEELNTMPLEEVIELMHPEDIQGVRDGIVKAINELDGLENSLEYRFKRKKNGEYLWLKDEFVVMQDDQGQPVSLIGSVSDITQRKESELQFKNLVEKSLVGVYIIQNSKFAYVNPKFAHDLGYTQQELLNLEDYRQILDEGYVPDALVQWREKAAEDIIDDFHIELKYKRKDGNIIWADIYCGETIYQGTKALLGSFQNITERKRMESERQKMLDEMLQRNRDLEQFAYIVSHNLRAPVANIIGISDYMQNTEVEAEEQEEMNSGLRKSVQRLDDVIKDLNNILQMKREISEKKETVVFSDLLDNIRSSIINLIEKEEVTFRSDFTAVDEIMTLKSYLHSIFYNLISNSIKYRRPEATPVIEIKSAVQENKIEILFKDNGLGIDLEKRGDQVFGLYKRFHTHAEGKGMGLYMVKTQVETLGGTIAIKSKINEGTEFKIEFEIEKNSN
ncbi:PAS domain S-box protein [Flavobacterium pedocola]